MADPKADGEKSPATEINADVVDTAKFPSTDNLSSSDLSPIDEDSLIGTLFEDKYQIEGKLGEGGMGVVYRATHAMMERPVAIKFLHSDRVTDAGAIERFKREARAAGRIQHPNATAVLDFGVTNNIFYLVMEYLEGRTLRDRLRSESNMAFKDTVKIVSQVCKAVEAAHKCSIIHRDLKPDNIFLQRRDDGEIVKVLDFGIAKITHSDAENYGTTTETFMGTPHYMSPEQCQANPLTPASDIYSLGVIVYEMLTGKLPFKGNSLLSIAIKHLNDPPPSMREMRPDIPESIEAVVMKALAKDPEKRQQSAEELADDLRKAMGWSSGSSSSKNIPIVSCSNPNCSRPKPNEAGRCMACNALLSGVMVRHRYEIKQMVGKGGFGTTYLVTDQDCLDESRILKELHSEQIRNEEEDDDGEDLNVAAQRLFKREAQVLLNLQHRGIPQLYAYFNDQEYTYLVQDYIPGRTLLEEIEARNRVFNEREARSLLEELADILEYLHTRTPPIVHRDIKPQNLMRHESGQLLLIDFGAVCQAASNPGMSQTLIGSPGYAPPEQIFGHPLPQSDLYAAAATVLRLITGVPPSQLFNNKTQRMEWESRVKVSPNFTVLLNDLLAQDAKKRLGSATELKRRLKELEAESRSIKPETKADTSFTFRISDELQTSLSNSLASHTQFSFGIKDTGSNAQATPTPASSAPAPAPMPATEDEAKSGMVYEEASVFINSQLYSSKRPPDETGRLQDSSVLSLLRRFYRERESGLLSCIDGPIIKIIHFEQGSIVFANSTLASERLGETLIRMGRISISDFEKAASVMKSSGVRFGSALIEMNRMTLEELTPLIITQVSNIIYSLFDWANGNYEIRFENPPKEQIKISLSTADIIFEGLRRMKNIDLMKSWLGDFTRKLTTTKDPLLLYQAVNLNPKEAFIVSRIVTAMSIEEILSLGGLPEVETLKTLCGLLAVGILEWVEKDHKPSKSRIPVSNVLGSPKSQQSTFDIQTAAAFCYEVEHMARTIDNMNYYALLGIERGASDDEIREAYSHMAKKFHPDRHAQLANYNFSLRSELEKIFEKISEAFRVLNDPSSRRDYDSIFRSSGKISTTTGDKKRNTSTPAGAFYKKDPKKR